jgi:predicted dehydrogenase
VKKFSVGIVGCGEITEGYHLPIFRKIDRLSVSWLCDVNLDRARHLAQRFGVPHAFGSLQECPDVDFVLVATPVGTRRNILSIIHQRKWHAFCEKPFAVNTEDHEFMLDGARANSLVLACGYMRRFYWGTRMAARFVQTMFDTGELHLVGSDSGRMKRSFHGGNWYLTNPAASGGGFLMETGSHLIDQMLSIVGADEVVIESSAQQKVGHVDFETIAAGFIRDRAGRRIDFDFALSRLRDLWTGIAVDSGPKTLAINLSPDSPIVLTNSIQKTRCSFPAPLGARVELVAAYTAQIIQFTDRIDECDVIGNPAATGILTTQFLSECYRRQSSASECCAEERL